MQLRSLPVTTAPIPAGGGRIHTPAGELAQIVNGPTFRFLAFLEFRPNAAKPRGNHYHRQKVEVLYVIRGRLRAAYEDLETGELYETELKAGDLAAVSPLCAHVYEAIEHTFAVELAEQEYDPNDTYPHVVTRTGSLSAST